MSHLQTSQKWDILGHFGTWGHQLACNGTGNMRVTRHSAISCIADSTDGKRCGVKAGYVSRAFKSSYPKSSTSTPSTQHAKGDTPGTPLLTADDLRPELLGSKPLTPLRATLVARGRLAVVGSRRRRRSTSSRLRRRGREKRVQVTQRPPRPAGPGLVERVNAMVAKEELPATPVVRPA